LDKLIAILPCAGFSTRMGGNVSKQFLDINGKPLIAYTLRVFQEHPAVGQIVLVLREEDVLWCQKHVVQRFHLNKTSLLVCGGPRRQDSVLQGLLAINVLPELILVHDGARPLVSREIVDRTIESAEVKGSGVAGVPVKDTIKQTDDQGCVIHTLNRDALWQVQTPQVFPGRALLEAYLEGRRKDYAVTDDAALMEKAGHPVHMVWGAYDNIKVTTQEDLVFVTEKLKNLQWRNTLKGGAL
jgi:2-C-methyl-D-erythritol 4-phosphate cytidylyltransferase